MLKITSAIIAVAVIASAVPAVAQTHGENVTAKVRIGDLDLADATDQVRLDKRVEHAIRRACRSGGFDHKSRRQETACRQNLTEVFAPRVELAIVRAREVHLAAITTDLGA